MKRWWQSKTILFGLVSGVLALVAIFFKHDLKEFTGQITDALLALGTIYTTYRIVKGRIDADTAIKRTNPGGPFNPNADVRKGTRAKRKRL